MKKHLALICDLDMTLIDSKKDIAAAVAFTASKISDSKITEDQVTPWIGKGLRSMFRGLLPGLDSKTEQEAVLIYRDRFFKHCNQHTIIFPKVTKTLISLRSRGIMVGVATAKMTFMAEHVCKTLALDKFLDYIQGTDELPPKPDPAVVLATCRIMKVKPVETVFIGDTIMDVEAGKRAGTTSVAVTYGIGNAEDLLAKEPDRIIDSFDEVESLFV